MKSLIHRNLGKIAALGVLGATLFLGGEYVSYSHPSAVRTSTATPTSVAQDTAPAAMPGFIGVAKAMTPAVVNITSKAARIRA